MTQLPLFTTANLVATGAWHAEVYSRIVGEPSTGLLDWWEEQPLPSIDPMFDKLARGDDTQRAWLRDSLDEIYEMFDRLGP